MMTDFRWCPDCARSTAGRCAAHGWQAITAAHLWLSESGLKVSAADAMNPDPMRAPETDDEPWDCAKGDDPLAPARGCWLALPLGCLAWVAFFGGLALLVSRVVR